MPRDSRTERTPALNASWSSTIRTFKVHFRFRNPEGGGCTLCGSRLYDRFQHGNQGSTLMKRLPRNSVTVNRRIQAPCFLRQTDTEPASALTDNGGGFAARAVSAAVAREC